MTVTSEILMPSLSPTMEKGNLARWLVREGDPVKTGDVLAEIETDKASMEFEATGDGVVSRIMVAAGTDDVPVGTVIALIGDAPADGASIGDVPADEPTTGEAAADEPTTGEPTTGEAALMADVSREVAGPGPAEDAPPPAMQTVAPSAPPSDRITGRASPLARRIAAAAGIDLAGVRGSGPGGKILKIDVLPDRPADASLPAPRAAPATPVHPPPAGIPHETVKLSGMRRTIAARLTEAKQAVPHFYLDVSVRLDALLALRRELNAAAADGAPRLSVNDFLVKALAVALERTPDANVQFGGDRLYRFGRVDVSMAVAIPGGLVTPVIVDAANKRLSHLAAEARDLAARARAGQLAPEEYQGGTASISNLGMFGMSSITPILNPPQALILGIATVMTVTGSFDHRAIDGAVGADLMRTFKTLVERAGGRLGLGGFARRTARPSSRGAANRSLPHADHPSDRDAILLGHLSPEGRSTMEGNSSIIRPKLHHVTIKTSHLDEMVAWYEAVVGVRVVFKDQFNAWTSNDRANHRVAFLAAPGLGPDEKKHYHNGTHHSAFEYDSFDDLMSSYRRMADEGIVPAFCLDHGLTISLYYEDPEGNYVELQSDNFGDWDVSTDFMRTSADFQSNPTGTSFDPEKVYQAHKSGMDFKVLQAAVRAGDYQPQASHQMGLPPKVPENVGGRCERRPIAARDGAGGGMGERR